MMSNYLLFTWANLLSEVVTVAGCSEFVACDLLGEFLPGVILARKESSL
jgi:hypothetical protein